MNKKEFDEWLNKLTHVEPIIVSVRFKYSHESNWTYRKEFLSPDYGYWMWENDWYEGQDEIEFLGYVFLSEVEIKKVWKENK